MADSMAPKMNRKPHAHVGEVAEPAQTSAVSPTQAPSPVSALAAAAGAILSATEPRRHIEAMRALGVALRAYQIWQAEA